MKSRLSILLGLFFDKHDRESNKYFVEEINFTKLGDVIINADKKRSEIKENKEEQKDSTESTSKMSISIN